MKTVERKAINGQEMSPEIWAGQSTLGTITQRRSSQRAPLFIVWRSHRSNGAPFPHLKKERDRPVIEMLQQIWVPLSCKVVTSKIYVYFYILYDLCCQKIKHWNGKKQCPCTFTLLSTMIIQFYVAVKDDWWLSDILILLLDWTTECLFS